MSERTDQSFLNAYRDIPSDALGEYGYDISSQRWDDLDYACLQFVTDRRDTRPRGIDLGCGLGSPSIAFALAGANMMLLDKADLRSRFEHISRLLRMIRLNFVQVELAMAADVIPRGIDFFYSQRTLHYLKYVDALELLKAIRRRMKAGARGFISASGMSSELSTRYEGSAQEVDVRFTVLDEAMADKHHIYVKVCLYSRVEFEQLVTSAGLVLIKVTESPFGNVKAIVENPREVDCL